MLLMFLVLCCPYYVSLRSEFRDVMSPTISVLKRCSVRLSLHLFVGGFTPYLPYLCLLAHSCVVFLCCLFFRLVCPLLSVSLYCVNVLL